ncbi:MAG: cell division protein FtsK, partial [Acutalibacteraceae bacterium]|nr:cell division protein FtsK [Acutalibacteraceae bacterium]
VTVKPDGVTGTFRMNLPYEVQCTLPYAVREDQGLETEEIFLSNLKQKFDFSDSKYNKQVKKYLTFPDELKMSDYERLKQPQNNREKEFKLPVSVALDYVNFCPVTVNLDESHVVAIYGKKEFGKTNLLNLLLNGIINQKPDSRIVFFDDGRNGLKDIYSKYQNIADSVYFNGFCEESISLQPLGPKPEEVRSKKLSPIQRFYLYLHNNYVDLPKNLIAGMFNIFEADARRVETKSEYEDTPFTVFVIQSKLVYLNTTENKYFIEKLLPRLAAVAEDKKYLFIFSDVQKMSDMETNTVFNSVVSTVLLLDNIAEFAGERGQKTVFGNMDIKDLKEDYAKCEKGDGYFYDIEADNLLKAKFIKFEEDTNYGG